ncbi:hypothetical protein A8990_11962 [Paenibacillus taihuensis]|uniref:VOC domain-containing protein n=1 Tax=Paenibacillus taihuensis TaxID=1156355 RepID=A0A3D9RP38_9BACL|nr:VOC family protein [Paenibacillus taihuensis]REE81228.1 hypothetical protein A8990_11962 [Paenibacillus taihuensis]
MKTEHSQVRAQMQDQAKVHPILPYMPTIFFPVRDLKQSIEWYTRLFEVSVEPKQDGGGIYYFTFEGTDIILDSNIWGFPPTIMFDASDIDEAYSFCQRSQLPITSDLFRYEHVAFFNVQGNMLCQHVRQPKDKDRQMHPLLTRIVRVIAHANDRKETEDWYSHFLELPAKPDSKFAGLTSFRMKRGADLLIDTNELAQTEKVHYDRLQLDLRVNPIVVIETPDIASALEFVRSKGAEASEGIVNRLGQQVFTFYDPDGNGLMVVQR